MSTSASTGISPSVYLNWPGGYDTVGDSVFLRPLPLSAEEVQRRKALQLASKDKTVQVAPKQIKATSASSSNGRISPVPSANGRPKMQKTAAELAAQEKAKKEWSDKMKALMDADCQERQGPELAEKLKRTNGTLAPEKTSYQIEAERRFEQAKLEARERPRKQKIRPPTPLSIDIPPVDIRPLALPPRSPSAATATTTFAFSIPPVALKSSKGSVFAVKRPSPLKPVSAMELQSTTPSPPTVPQEAVDALMQLDKAAETTVSLPATAPSQDAIDGLLKPKTD